MATIWGEEHDRKTNEFNRQVEIIEEKYKTIFQDHVDIIKGEKPDRLRNQFLLQTDSTKHQCGFMKDTYVPDYIQKEVYAVFKSVFSDK